jgi:hypothetical protein
MRSVGRMPLVNSQTILNACFTVPVLYIILLFIPFSGSRSSVIPLTYRTAFNEWGRLRTLYEDAPTPLSWSNISAVVWCPLGSDTSPQCGCFRDYYENTYLPDSLNASLTARALGMKHGRSALMECLRFRQSWRKQACGQFCRLHISTPVILSCLYMLLFFSKLVKSEYAVIMWAVEYAPGVLGLVTIALQLAFELSGGIVSSLSVVSAMTESIYVSRAATVEQVFWSYHRYLCGAIAVWAAVTHQARDVYSVAMYGMYGFTAGLLAYMVYLVKSGQPCKTNLHTCITTWLGICAVVAMFVTVLQQHWYSHSQLKSSMVSVVSLIVCLGQCLFQTPYDIAPVSLHVLLSLIVLSLSFWAVMVDTWGVS